VKGRRKPAAPETLSLGLFDAPEPPPSPSPPPARRSRSAPPEPAVRAYDVATYDMTSLDLSALPLDPLAAYDVLAEPTYDPYSATAEIPGSSSASAVAVSTLTQTTKDLVEGAFLPLWVRGEVSDFKSHRNGHWYFTLRDQSAQIRCVVWARDQRRMPAPPDEGMQVTALAQVTVYAARGDLQLSVKAMEAAGDGLRRKALLASQAALAADGLLDPARRRAIPRLARRIAVVTSPDGAALHDVAAIARRRWSAVELVVVPTKVQGEGAAEEICRALDRVARWADADVVIVGRGGGAREDLWAFNDERVARALAACPIPTISAVGHEVDITLCDLVADLRAATPSEAAEAAVAVHADLVDHVARLREQLRLATEERCAGERRRVADAARRLRTGAERLAAGRRIRVSQAAAQLQALSPLATLARGYAVARDDAGRTLGAVTDFAPGDSFSLLLRDGTVHAEARRVEPAVLERPDHASDADLTSTSDSPVPPPTA
jgi:exodeoxyribonuclease VII large subunit